MTLRDFNARGLIASPKKCVYFFRIFSCSGLIKTCLWQVKLSFPSAVSTFLKKGGEKNGLPHQFGLNKLITVVYNNQDCLLRIFLCFCTQLLDAPGLTDF